MAGVPLSGELPSAESVREAVERVLSRPEFRKEAPSVWTSILDSIGDALDGIFDALGDALGGTLTSVLSERIVLVVLLLVLGAVALRLAWSALQLQASGAGGRRAPAGAAPADADDTDGHAQTDLAEAERLARAGAFAGAMHALYRGTLLDLDRQGRVRLERFKTGADYATDLGPALAPAFRSLLAAYSPVAFGGREAREPEWQAMRRAASSLGPGP